MKARGPVYAYANAGGLRALGVDHREDGVYLRLVEVEDGLITQWVGPFEALYLGHAVAGTRPEEKVDAWPPRP